MRIAIIGTGAVGGYYGALLAKHGNEVHFLLKSDYQYVKIHGLRVESPDGDFVLPEVNAWNNAKEMPVCELIVVATKSTDNHIMAEIIPAVSNEHSHILILQNGIGLEAQFQRLAPEATVYGGLCFLTSNKIGPGHIRHLGYGTIKLAQYDDDRAAGLTDNLHKINEILNAAGIPTQIREDLSKSRWEKLVWNAAFNGLSVVLKETTDKLVTYPETRRLLFNIMGEVIQAAHACGHHIASDFPQEMMRLTDEMAAYSPSMKLDCEAGRPLEIGAIYWSAISLAEKHGYDMKMCRVLAQQLQFIDHRNRQL